ncbi:MAG: hypothetical protein ACYC61_14925 [Isosphaeraceae bacterium]
MMPSRVMNIVVPAIAAAVVGIALTERFAEKLRPAFVPFGGPLAVMLIVDLQCRTPPQEGEGSPDQARLQDVVRRINSDEVLPEILDDPQIASLPWIQCASDRLAIVQQAVSVYAFVIPSHGVVMNLIVRPLAANSAYELADSLARAVVARDPELVLSIPPFPPITPPNAVNIIPGILDEPWKVAAYRGLSYAMIGGLVVLYWRLATRRRNSAYVTT